VNFQLQVFPIDKFATVGDEVLVWVLFSTRIDGHACEYYSSNFLSPRTCSLESGQCSDAVSTRSTALINRVTGINQSPVELLLKIVVYSKSRQPVDPSWESHKRCDATPHDTICSLSGNIHYFPMISSWMVSYSTET
jgi:hypothetical protein